MALKNLVFLKLPHLELLESLLGILYFVVARKYVLPNDKRKNNAGEGHKLSPKQLAADYELGGNLHRIRVVEDSSIIGKQLAELKLPAKYHLSYFEN